jgi:hypothetical protein
MGVSIVLLAVLFRGAYATAEGDCDCVDPKGAWTYSGWKIDGVVQNDITVHGGCAVTPDWPGQAWCYLKDGVTAGTGANQCPFAQASTVVDGAFYKECDPCACKNHWTYLAKDTQHMGCMKDAEWGAWCYTQGMNPYCSQSTASPNADEKQHWRNCNPCACQNKWLYKQTGEEKAAVRHRCFDDTKWGAKWCYVEGNENCDLALPSEVKGEMRHYRKCGRETCGDHKNTYKGNECCGSPTKKWPLQDIQ